MPFTLNMPKLSPTMTEGTIVKWHKKEGDQVEPGDLLMEVATDKATVEHNALDSGWLRKIVVQEGSDAIVNQAIAILTEKKDESIEGFKIKGETPQSELKPEVVEEKPLQKTEKQSETQKSPAPISQAGFAPEPALEQYSFEYPSDKIEARIKASPLARKLAKEKNLDLTTVKGTGPNQRITSQDLELAQPSGIAAFGSREVPRVSPGTYEEEKLTQMRKAIAQKLQEAKMYIPHFYVDLQIDAKPLFDIYEQLKSQEIKVTYNDFVIKAASLALRQHPAINSGFNSVNQTLIRFKTVDISVAVSIPDGLITPIVRHADFKNLGEISIEVRSLVRKAKTGKLEATEYKGGSFTISNLGMYGITQFQAVINPPQAAILAVGGILDTPVIKNGNIVPGKIMNLSLSVDHRVIDGASAAEFLRTLKQLLEAPAILLI